MISAIISLLVGLVILYVCYLLIEWVLGFIGLVPAVFTKIIYIIFVVIACVMVLNFLGGFLGLGTYHFLN